MILIASLSLLLDEAQDWYDIRKVAPSYASGARLKSPLHSIISNVAFSLASKLSVHYTRDLAGGLVRRAELLRSSNNILAAP